MNLWLTTAARLLLIATLLGSEWCASAQCDEQHASGSSDNATACVSNGDLLGMVQIVLRSRGDSFGRIDSFSPLPQDNGQSATAGLELAANSKHPFLFSSQDGWAALSGQSLLLQRTRLQL